MASWITDGSSGFTIDGNVITYVDESMSHALWREGDGVTSGKHYWKVHFPTLGDIGAVGLTSSDGLKKGYACRSIEYLGNLTNCSSLLVGSFGPSPKQGDVIGILIVYDEEGRLKVYIDVNEKSLGLAFDIPAFTFKTIFPMVSFYGTGSATCTKQTEIPDITSRAQTTFEGIDGDWKLLSLMKDSELLDLPLPATTNIKKTAEDEYSWHTEVINNLETELSKSDDGSWKTSGICSTMMGSTPEYLTLEFRISFMMRDVKTLEVAENGNLSIACDNFSSTWVRYDATPGPFIGKPFAPFS